MTDTSDREAASQHSLACAVKPPTTFRLLFSYSHDKTAHYFQTHIAKLSYKLFFKNFDFKKVNNSIFSNDQYKQDLCQVNDGIIPLDNDRYMLVQYQRPDGKHEFRYVIVNGLLTRGNEEKLKYSYYRGLSDLGLPIWSRCSLGVGPPYDVIAQPKYLLISTTGDLKDFKRLYLTDGPSRSRMKTKDNPAVGYQNEDFRHPCKPFISRDVYMYISEFTNMLYGMNFDNLALIPIAENVESYDYNGRELFYFKNTNNHNQLYYLKLSPSNLQRGNNFRNNTHLSIDTQVHIAKKQIQKDIVCELKDRIIKTEGLVTLIAGRYPKRGIKQFLLASKPYMNGKFRSRHIALHDTWIDLDFAAEVFENNFSTPLIKIEFMISEFRHKVMIALESYQLHILFHLPEAKKFGTLRSNMSLSADRTSEIYGMTKLHDHRVLFYGYYVNVIYQISLKVKNFV